MRNQKEMQNMNIKHALLVCLSQLVIDMLFVSHMNLIRTTLKSLSQQIIGNLASTVR